MDDFETFAELFTNLAEHPGVFLLSGTMEEFVAFINGVDAGTRGWLLEGAREWVQVQLKKCSNMALPVLLVDAAVEAGFVTDRRDDYQVRHGIVRVLDDFWEHRSRRDGLRIIHLEFERLQRRQSYYGPEHPSWVGFLPDEPKGHRHAEES